MKINHGRQSDNAHEQPLVRQFDPENQDQTMSDSEVSLEQESSNSGGFHKVQVLADSLISQVSSAKGFFRIMPPFTAVLIVFTVILHMTVGQGAALRPQDEITCVDEGVYMIAEYESQPYLDSDFNRNASETELDVNSTFSSEEDIIETSLTEASSDLLTDNDGEEQDLIIAENITDLSENTEETEPVQTPTESEPELPAFAEVDHNLFLGADRVNLRSDPDTDSDVVDVLSLGTKAHRTGMSDEWSLITSENGNSGYLMSKFLVEVKPEPTPTPTPEPTPTPAPEPAPTKAPAPAAVTTSPGSAISADKQQEMVSKARSHLGETYVYAGSQPGSFDCSGFTSYMYRSMFNIELPRTTSGQLGSGISVSLADIQIGDIICFDWKRNGGCDHVGLYVGGGQYVHASYSRGRVAEGSIRSSDPIISVRRIIY